MSKNALHPATALMDATLKALNTPARIADEPELVKTVQTRCVEALLELGNASLAPHSCREYLKRALRLTAEALAAAEILDPELPDLPDETIMREPWPEPDPYYTDDERRGQADAINGTRFLSFP
ncbi:MAG: hypothetical protein FJX76_01585 [Armatimonadetes bacterium]|nr:hypothetical protein [Armatimonadota bacterium]